MADDQGDEDIARGSEAMLGRAGSAAKTNQAIATPRMKTRRAASRKRRVPLRHQSGQDPLPRVEPAPYSSPGDAAVVRCTRLVTLTPAIRRNAWRASTTLFVSLQGSAWTARPSAIGPL